MLENQVVIVTGGSRGIGRAISLKLASVGADVVILYAGNQVKAEETVSEISQLGRKSLALQVDVSDADQVNQAFQEVMKLFGKIDVLINNAGITKDNLVMRMNEEDWNRVMDVDLKGVFLCSKAVMRPMMKQRKGRIINISSVVGVAGNPGQANYAAAKAGVIGLTKTLAKELASRNITVNALAPGFIETDINSDLSKKQSWREETMKLIPLRRAGTPEDVSEVVLFLASESSRYITGQTIHVDGGMII
ncbi:MAG: 3-oxoacyl-[acyl-carrier-protein] reductase [Bacillota bacterium]